MEEGRRSESQRAEGRRNHLPPSYLFSSVLCSLLILHRTFPPLPAPFLPLPFKKEHGRRDKAEFSLLLLSTLFYHSTSRCLLFTCFGIHELSSVPS